MMRRGYGLLGSLVVGVALVAGCVEQEPALPTEADLKVIRENILKQAPKPQIQVNADLEGKVTYLGLDVDKTEIKPGEPFTLTHYWKVVKPISGWKIFVHLDNAARTRFINADHKPIDGRYPASLWKPGEIIRDRHRITLPDDWDAAQLFVFTGLWRGMERMVPKGPQDDQKRIIAAKLPVRVKAGKRGRKLPTAVAPRSAKPIVVDGRLSEPAWQAARWTGLFVDTMTGAAAAVKTMAKLAWDDKYLYVAFDNKDEDVWSSLKKRDEKLWTQEAVEVFIDANGDGKDYVELQVNPNGAIFDSYLPSYRKNDNAWNSRMKAAVVVNGTLNKRDDKDQGWTVEIAIPWADTKGKGQYDLQLPPKPGDKWRINLFRLDMPQRKPQRAAAWSPPLVGDFHKLARFGTVQFAGESGKVPAAAPAVVSSTAVAKPAATAKPASKQAGKAPVADKSPKP